MNLASINSAYAAAIAAIPRMQRKTAHDLGALLFTAANADKELNLALIPEMATNLQFAIALLPDEYREAVRATALKQIASTPGSPDRGAPPSASDQTCPIT